MIDSTDEGILFLCPSFSVSSILYEIYIDKSEGTIRCDCLDSRCRHKIDLITATTPRVCKHARAVLRLAGLLQL